MLIRKIRRGDCLTVGGVVIIVRKATEGNLTLAIAAPEGVQINHARDGESALKEAAEIAP